MTASREPRPKRDALLDAVAPDEVEALRSGRSSDPHRLLGAHPARVGRREGLVVRAFHPDASAAELIPGDGAPIALESLDGGLFASFRPGARAPLRYRLRFHFPDGSAWERGDPYRFLPTLGELDLHLIGEGTHRRLWEVLGARECVVDGEPGTAFSVWAPNARRVSVVGDFNAWDGRLLPMRSLGSTGVFELFAPGVAAGSLYKFEILTREGALRIKTDPLARWMDLPPDCAARLYTSRYEWSDAEWMERRVTRDWQREPVSIYEAHLGSWARVPEQGNRALSYREIAPRLAEHVKRLGFTHIEFLPLAEHAFYGSWGYQVTGYYAPTSRYGSPDDLRFLVDTCHRHGLGVILDWVPAHFPKDDFSLRRFDGTPLYEHADPRLGEHPDWGTLIFDYGRPEVRNFLVANALYWLREFHVDGLRVDAVASMLYLDYSRKEGEWRPNVRGGRENLDAVDLLRAVNDAVREEAPGAITVAEESTSWPGVTQPTREGGLGFTFKWNMGWMHDTLEYFQKDPIHRRYHQDQLTFAMVYEQSERFVNALSHDEVVHGKGALLAKMPGDAWSRLANLRLLLAYMFTRPGKKLLFMGTELAPEREWNHDGSLDWHLASVPGHEGVALLLEDLGRLYAEHPCLWRSDPDPSGFEWIDASDQQQSIVSYARRDGGDHAVVVLNLTPTPRDGYRIGVPGAAVYRELLSSDAARYGGSGYATVARAESEGVPWHGRDRSVRICLPPLGAVILAPSG